MQVKEYIQTQLPLFDDVMENQANTEKMVIIDIDFDKNGEWQTVMVLPDDQYFPYPSSTVTSYAYIGQHGAFDLEWFYLPEQLKTTSEEDRKEMLAHLEAIGYDLESYELITNKPELLRLEL